MSLQQKIREIMKRTEGPEFTLKEASNGNVQLQLTKDNMKTLKTEEQWRAFLATADILRKEGIDCVIRGSFKGNDGAWVHYPSLWCNVTPAAKAEEDDARIARMVAAALAALQKKGEEAPAPVEETPAREF